MINKIINLKAKFDEMKDRINDGYFIFGRCRINERKLIEKEDALINHGLASQRIILLISYCQYTQNLQIQ
jgi:hypothetical protein